MTGSIYDWAISADNNATADGNINWQEFQDPSTVNNSARAMMGRLAELVADLAPKRTSTRAQNVYQVHDLNRCWAVLSAIWIELFALALLALGGRLKSDAGDLLIAQPLSRLRIGP